MTAPTTALVLAAFAFAYVAMAAGRVPGLKLDRAGAAFVALAALLVFGATDVERVGRAIDAPTLLLLFGLMVVSGQFAASGFYDRCAARLAAAKVSPRMLLALVVAVAGGLSALLANDVVVFAMTPLLCAGLVRRGLDPRPFLIGLACASNAGSAATIIGNPQNILIGQAGQLDFWRFLAVCGPPALASMAVAWATISLQWRAQLAPPAVAAHPAVEPPAYDAGQTTKGWIAVAALIGLFLTPLPREVAALGVAAALLLSRRIGTQRLLSGVDWSLLLLFACLFALNARFADTGVASGAMAWLTAQGLLPDRLLVLAPLSLAASNTISNVPTVMLLLAVWPNPSPEALMGLALLSTLAGNLFIVGSLANIIVVERAAGVGVRLGFADHARSGVPVTLATMGLACVWLWGIGALRW